jgi:hypothetical protein
MINNKKVVLEAKYPMKRVIEYILKHVKQQKKNDLNTSLELTENHYVNKNVRKIDKEKSQHEMLKNSNKYSLVANHSRQRKVSKKMKKRGYCDISDLCLMNKKATNNIYSSLKNEKHQNKKSVIPRPVKAMPVIPFWRSSFEMMTKLTQNNKSFQNKEHIERRRSSWLYANNSFSSISNYYVTMKKRAPKQENIYI